MKKDNGIIIALIIVCVLSVISVIVYIGNDKKGPVMTIDKSKIKSYSSEQGENSLTQYVKAIDEKDGDVSDTVIVESIYVMSDLKTAKVIFAARDKSNNISKLDYIVDYVASEDEINAKNNRNNEETQKAADSLSSTTTASETKKSDETTVVTTVEKTIAETTQAVTVAGGPKLVLTETEDTITKGSTFNIMKYISELSDDKDTSDILSRRMIVNGNYSTTTEGDYTLDVYCTDSDKNESNHVKFVLHVK